MARGCNFRLDGVDCVDISFVEIIPMNCLDCGKEALPPYKRCGECQEKWQKGADHWTMPEDPETKAGWGIFNFDWLMKPYREAVEWHDRVTTKGSTAQQMGITNERINAAWKDMLEEMCRTTPAQDSSKDLDGLRDFLCRKLIDSFMRDRFVEALTLPNLRPPLA